MKVVQLTPGSGGTFYCENCMRDSAMGRAMRRLGADVVMVPMYLPLYTGARELTGDVPVFFGGINVYLQQQFKLFRKTPRWIDMFFDSPWMLRQAAAREGTTDAADLGPMTLSMLRGRDGRQRKEIDRLLEWLGEHENPDVVHVSNALLLGVATEIKSALGVPIVCSLQDEHTWLDAIEGPSRQECWDEMAEQAKDVDRFVAVSEWYAGEMCRRMSLPRKQVSVLPVGIDLEGVQPAEAAPEPPVIGYLSRMSENLGLGLLVDAFIALKQGPEFRNLRLRATGGRTAADDAFLEHVNARLKERGVEDSVDFVDDFQQEGRHAFLRGLSVLSVPVPEGEAFGTFIIEAMGFGVPVVEPAVGAFPELIEATGGGICYDPADDGALAAALEDLLANPEHARELGRRGRASVVERYSVDVVAGQMLDLYEMVVNP